MHEAALAQELVSLVERIARENSAKSVTKATVELGELACVVPDALSFAFEIARAGSIAASCELVLTSAPLVVRCPSCGYHGPAARGATGCPRCDAVPVEVVSGRDMRLVSIDVEDDDDA